MHYFTSWLHSERRACSLSVTELSESVGKTKMLVVSWYRGVVPRASELSGMCRFFASHYRQCHRLSDSESEILAQVLYREAVQKILLDNTIRSIS